MAALGKAVQGAPIEPTLKPTGTKLLKLQYDGQVSNFAFNFNLRYYNWVQRAPRVTCRTGTPGMRWAQGVIWVKWVEWT